MDWPIRRFAGTGGRVLDNRATIGERARSRPPAWIRAATAGSPPEERPPVIERIAFIAACLVLPVLWGIAVNRVFDLWQKRSADAEEPGGSNDEPIFPDFQI